MHWFWRGIISIVAGIVVGAASFESMMYAGEWITLHLPHAQDFGLYWYWRFVYTSIGSVLVFGPAGIGTILTYGALHRIGSRRYAPPDETRCRKCNYILRGITEPRCPECGERI